MHKNYNMKQVILPLDLEIMIPEDDICFAIHELTESMPEEKFTTFKQETGRPSFHPRMMLKLILCAYTQSMFSGRKIENALQDSIRMMWLAQGETPSYRTINRYRVHPLMAPIIQDCFVQFRNLLILVLVGSSHEALSYFILRISAVDWSFLQQIPNLEYWFYEAPTTALCRKW